MCPPHVELVDARIEKVHVDIGLDVPAANLAKLLSVDVTGWLAEIPLIKEHFAKFGNHLPEALNREVAGLEQRLRPATK